MKISQKIELFRQAGLKRFSRVGLAGLEELGIPHVKFLRNLVFERSVSVSSPTVSQSLSTFMGAYSYMNAGGCLRANVFVGRYCSIGRRVTVGAPMHSMSGVSTHPALRQGSARPYTEAERLSLGIQDTERVQTVVENDVWIGDGAVLLPGITVATGAVIGANAVVTNDVPPYAVVAGVPARVIRRRMSEDVIARLLQTEWWELDVQTLQSLPVGHVLEFIDAMRERGDASAGRHVFETFVFEG